MTEAQARRPEFTYISPSRLHFDPTNPRFGGSAGDMDDEKIQGLLERAPHYALDLVDSFLTNGYIDYEPLVVKRDGNDFVVVEGNRRLAAVRHILNNREAFEQKSPKVADLDEIPVLIFPEAIGSQERQEQRVYLGVRHLFGFRDWPAESKAKYLDSNIRTKDDLDRVMRELNIKRVEVRRYLVPFRLRNSAQDLWAPYKSQDFWVLGEGLNRSGINAYIGLDVDRDSLKIRGFDRAKMKNLLHFIYGTPKNKQLVDRKIRETRDLSKLAQVLESKRATTVLERGSSLDEAALLIESRQESLKSLRRLMNELKVLLKGILPKGRKRPESQALIGSFASFEKAAKKFIRDAQKPGV